MDVWYVDHRSFALDCADPVHDGRDGPLARGRLGDGQRDDATVRPGATTDQGGLVRLLVVGAGGHAKVVIDAAAASRAARSPASSACRRTRPSVLGYPVTTDGSGIEADALHRRHRRQRDARRATSPSTARAACTGARVVHPSAVIGPSVEHRRRARFVAAGVVVNAGARIGENAILNTGCTVDHDCRGRRSRPRRPACGLCGGVRLGEGVTLRRGATRSPAHVAWAPGASSAPVRPS